MSKNLKVTQKLAPLLSIMKPGETDIAARSISQTGLGMVDAAPLHRGLTSHDPFHSHGRAFSKGVFKKFNRTRGRRRWSQEAERGRRRCRGGRGLGLDSRHVRPANLPFSNGSTAALIPSIHSHC